MVEALAGGIKKVLGASLEVNEVVTFHFVFYIISGAPMQLILAGRSLLLINVDQNCNKHWLHRAKKSPIQLKKFQISETQRTIYGGLL